MGTSLFGDILISYDFGMSNYENFCTHESKGIPFSDGKIMLCIVTYAAKVYS
jgi:hypothetical protein